MHKQTERGKEARNAKAHSCLAAPRRKFGGIMPCPHPELHWQSIVSAAGCETFVIFTSQLEERQILPEERTLLSRDRWLCFKADSTGFLTKLQKLRSPTLPVCAPYILWPLPWCLECVSFGNKTPCIQMLPVVLWCPLVHVRSFMIHDFHLFMFGEYVNHPRVLKLTLCG